MSLATKQMGGIQEGITNRDKDVFITSSATVLTKAMTVADRHLRIITAAAAGEAIVVTLPSVKEARGLIFDIVLVTKDTYNVTIQDKDDDAALSDISLDTSLDYTVLFSNGFEWRELVSEKA